MCITHADFFRLLPAALGGMRFNQNGLRIEATDGKRGVVIELSDEREQKLGAFTLPLVTVTFASHGLRESEWVNFLSKFDRIFQRGGG